MSTTIYYFSGTGNSLALAKRVAAELPDARTVPMTGEPCNANTDDRVGFVFPTYAYGVPRIVREFVKQVPIHRDSYVFAVAGSCGIPGPVLKQLKSILRKRDIRLHAGFTVLDERSSLSNDPDDPIQKLMISVNKGQNPEHSSKRVPEIVEKVKSKSVHKPESSNLMTNIFGRILNQLASSALSKSAEHFWTESSCIGCGLCAQLCPRDNITFEENKPVWGQNCEFCHACIQWCPQQAIQYKEMTKDKPRYHNPEISAADMLPEGAAAGNRREHV